MNQAQTIAPNQAIAARKSWQCARALHTAHIKGTINQARSFLGKHKEYSNKPTSLETIAAYKKWLNTPRVNKPAQPTQSPNNQSSTHENGNWQFCNNILIDDNHTKVTIGDISNEIISQDLLVKIHKLKEEYDPLQIITSTLILLKLETI